MTVRLKSLLILGLILFLYGIYYWGIPAIVNVSSRIELIKSLSQKAGYKIELVNPKLKMGLRPSIIVSADSFELLNDDKSKALEIKSPYVKIAILPFLFKRIDIRDFTADKIVAQIYYDKNIKIGQYPINFDVKTAMKLAHAKAKLNEYRFDMQDLNNGKRLSLVGQYLDLDSFRPDSRLIVSTTADLYTDSYSSKFSLDLNTKLPVNRISQEDLKVDGQIINLNLDDFTPYARVLSKGEIQRLSGIVNSTAKTVVYADRQKKITTYTEINNLKIDDKDPDATIFCDEKMKISSELTILKNGIQLDNLTFLTGGINAKVSGNITRLTSKFPVLDLNVKIFDTKAEKVIPLLPGLKNLIGEINLLKLKQTGFWGDVNGELKIKGKSDFPDVLGKITVSEAYLVKPIPNASKAKIDLDFTGQKLNLDAYVPTAPNQYVDVKGPIELYKERNADLKISSTERIDFQTAQTVLNPLHEILKFQLGPVPIMKLYGTGNIQLRISGNKKRPHAWGKFNFTNTTASFNDIHNLILKNGSGELTFNNEDTHFVTKTAILNGQPVKVDGTCTLQGVMDFTVQANNQDLENLVKVIKTSPMLADIQQMILPVEYAQGPADLKLNITGKVKDPNEIVFNKNLFASGVLNLHSGKIKLLELPLSLDNVKGKAEFENTKVSLNLTSSINQSKINMQGDIKDNKCNLKVSSNHLSLGDIITTLPSLHIPYKDDISKIYSSFTSEYSGAVNPINYNLIKMKGRVYPSRGTALSINGGNFELENSNFKLETMSGNLKGSQYSLSANVKDSFSKKAKVSGDFKIRNFDISNINDRNLKGFLPEQISKQLNDFRNFHGVVSLDCKVRNNNIRAFTRLNDISVNYLPSRIRLNVKSGHLFLNNDVLHISKINSQFGEMPVLLDGKVNNVFSKTPKLNLYVNAKPTQEFFDQFFNNKAVYPIKLKGDILLTSKITGAFDNLHTKSELKMDEDSSLYYMGASIGDSQNPVIIALDSNITPYGITLNRFQYDKIISSQNNRPFITPQLTVSGAITYLPDNNAAFNNLKIKTQSPTDAKIFNIIFRKPIMKQGVFTSDLLLNGTTINPKIRGKLEVTSVDIPFLDSTVKDISLDFKPDKIFIHSRGVFLTNNISLDAVAKNSLTPPYIVEDVKLRLADLDINDITARLRDMEAEASTKTKSVSENTRQAFDISQVILKNADVTANTISVRNIRANNLAASLAFDEKMVLDIKNFKFNIAEGNVTGRFRNNLLTHAIVLDLNLDRANAQIMTEALFDLKGQIYGSMTGNVDLICNGTSYERCMQTLHGKGSFIVSEGKMPKLGSLEYLLKAGNLLRGGLMGLSINSIIDFITPLKTGEFNSISGDIKIKNGIVSPINIYSDGKDLNMYLNGSYNIVTSLADMKIFGSLSRDVTNTFGKIKNASLNTLLNIIPGVNKEEEPSEFQAEIEKIPGFKTQSNVSRLFNAEIYGDINGDNYVKSFRWIK